MKPDQLPRFLLIACVVGMLLPFFVSICLFGQTLQSFVAPPKHEQVFWSGAPTPVPTPVPGPVQAWTGTALSLQGGVIFVLWSILGACAGEATALRLPGKARAARRKAWLGAIAGSIVFIGISLFGLPR